MNLQTEFNDILNSWLETAPDKHGALDICVGEFILADNPALLLEISNQMSEHEDFLGFKTFQKLLLSQNEKPTPPKQDDPEFDPPGIKYRSQIRTQNGANLPLQKSTQKL